MRLSILLFNSFYLIGGAFLIKSNWRKDSWKYKKDSIQLPKYYESSNIYQYTMEQLQKNAPLVFSQEIRNLHKELENVYSQKSFILIGGDCMERFEDSNVNKIWNDYKLFLKMSLIMTFGMEKSIVKIARIGGQYAKPRSVCLETKNNETLPSYQGDIINGHNFTKSDRVPDPIRMLYAYYYSVQTMNILRSFIQGGYFDIYNFEKWNVDNIFENESYKKFVKTFKKTLSFLSVLSITPENTRVLRDVNLYTGHECLLLPYEQCFVRNDSITGKLYDCSAHFLWIGERTRELDGPHIEFIRGLENPIGVKISEKITPDELLNMTMILNPENRPGRLSIMTRMGASNLKKSLPSLIQILQKHTRHVIWICDPMHANTVIYKDINGKDIKTRFVDDILDEIKTFFEIHRKYKSYAGGLHLEMSGNPNITECIGTSISNTQNYESKMDPRLNPEQAIDIALSISKKWD